MIAVTFLSQQSVLFTSLGTKNKAANFSADFRLINNEKDLKEVLLDKNKLSEREPSTKGVESIKSEQRVPNIPFIEPSI